MRKRERSAEWRSASHIEEKGRDLPGGMEWDLHVAERICSCRWIHRLKRPIFRCGHFHYRKKEQRADKNKHQGAWMLFLPAGTLRCTGLHCTALSQKHHMAQTKLNSK